MANASTNNRKSNTATATSLSFANDAVTRDASSHQLSIAVILYLFNSSPGAVSGTYDGVGLTNRVQYAYSSTPNIAILTLDNVLAGAKTVACSWTANCLYVAQLITINSDGYDNKANNGWSNENTYNTISLTSQTGGIGYDARSATRMGDSGGQTNIIPASGADGSRYGLQSAAGAASITFGWSTGFTGDGVQMTSCAVSFKPATLIYGLSSAKVIWI